MFDRMTLGELQLVAVFGLKRVVVSLTQSKTARDIAKRAHLVKANHSVGGSHAQKGVEDLGSCFLIQLFSQGASKPLNERSIETQGVGCENFQIAVTLELANPLMRPSSAFKWSASSGLILRSL